MIFGAILYLIALAAQILAAIYSYNLFRRASAYRIANGCLLISLVLTIFARIWHVAHEYREGYIDFVDLWFSVPIAIFILLGVIQYKKILLELEDKNFVLDQSLKMDALTSASSRIETFSRVDLEIKKSFRSKGCIAYLMVDIDLFKNINDTYGHPIGDKVLIGLVKRCMETLREIDILGRVGGEEFLIVLPGTNASQAREVAERLRLSVANMPCASVMNHEIFITISIGIAIFDPCAEPEEDSIEILKNIMSSVIKQCTAPRNQAEIKSASKLV